MSSNPKILTNLPLASIPTSTQKIHHLPGIAQVLNIQHNRFVYAFHTRVHLAFLTDFVFLYSLRHGLNHASMSSKSNERPQNPEEYEVYIIK
jgi:hypothetical protein